MEIVFRIDNSIVKDYNTTNNRPGFKELLADLRQLEQTIRRYIDYYNTRESK